MEKIHAHSTYAAENQLSSILTQKKRDNEFCSPLHLLWLFNNVLTLSAQSMLSLPNLQTASPLLALQLCSM